MKKLICIFVLLCATSVSAQDIIVKRNGEEIKAKVEEVGEQSIRYRKFANLSGPIYSLARADVFVIRYESGAKDVITPLDQPQTAAVSQSAGTAGQTAAVDYAQINRQMKKSKEPLRDKEFYIGPRLEIGYAGVMSKGGNLSGLMYSAGVEAEYMFDRQSPNGLGVGLTYDGYSLDSDVELNYMGVDLYYVYRPRAHCNFLGGITMGIPVKSEMAGVDAKEVTNTTFGFEIGGGWATRHFDLGAVIFSNFSNTFDLSESNRILGVKLRIAYRF